MQALLEGRQVPQEKANNVSRWGLHNGLERRCMKTATACEESVLNQFNSGQGRNRG